MESQLWKGALLPSSITGIIGIVIMGIIHGRPGIIGGILAEFIVLIFFAVHLIISVISNKLDPIITVALRVQPRNLPNSFPGLNACLRASNGKLVSFILGVMVDW